MKFIPTLRTSALYLGSVAMWTMVCVYFMDPQQSIYGRLIALGTDATYWACVVVVLTSAWIANPNSSAGTMVASLKSRVAKPTGLGSPPSDTGR